MIVDISKIKDSEGKVPVDDVLELGKVTFGGGEYEFSEVKVTGKVVNIGGSLELEATAVGEYKTPCARCLKPVLISFDADIYEGLVGEEANKELIRIEGNKVFLDDLISNSLLSDLPMTELCSDDCKGICQSCGKNLNEGPCDCKDDNWDSRFDILKNFKADL